MAKGSRRQQAQGAGDDSLTSLESPAADSVRKGTKRPLQEQDVADNVSAAPAKRMGLAQETALGVGIEKEMDLDPAAFRSKMHISSPSNADLPDPVQSFDASPFSKKVRVALKVAGFTAPTAVQAQGWPLAVRGDDLVSVAKTGSGKTLAFLLPAFRRICKEQLDPTAGPPALVLAPTRELATQIHEVAESFGDRNGVCTAVVFGGVPKGPQTKALQGGPHLVVATPGRMVDLMNDGVANLGSVKFLVLDEADRMLDMGFEPQMVKIMSQVPAERQTLLFSATWPKNVQKLARNYLKKDFTHINVGETQELAANKAVTQEFFKLDDDEKENKLWGILYDMGENTKIIIFANTKHRINSLQKAVWNAGYDCVAMHGDKSQKERDCSLAKFVSGEVPVMLATDVCARGLDIKDVTHVLNFDMARDVESYIHRIGRTGRAEASGVSITFFNEAYDMECAPALAKIAREAGQQVPPFLEKAAEKAKNTKNKQWRY